MWVLLVGSLQAQSHPAWPGGESALDRAFRHMYDLDFATARLEIAASQTQQPQDPLGPAAEAALHLFSEFGRLQILQAELFETDDKFRARRKPKPDQAIKQAFDTALARAEGLSQRRLAQDARDRLGLFAMVLANGMRADYAALIEKRDLAARLEAKAQP